MNWPAKKYKIEHIFGLPRHKVWELLSDTNHLNKMIGLFNVQMVLPSIGNGGLLREMLAKVGGLIPMRWNETPFQWEKNTYYSVIREYKDGPLQRFYGGIELSDAKGENGEPATLVRLFSEFTPANALGVAVIPITGAGSMRKVIKYLEQYLKLLELGKSEQKPQAAPGSSIHTQELDRLIAELKKMPVHPELTESLKQHLQNSGDDEVVDMHPYQLAPIWGTSREEALRLFLYATKVGITNLSWHLICPNCRVSKSQVETLSKLSVQFHCDFCGINYEANFDRYVELCFTVHSTIRSARKELFCIGGPMLTPHIYAQAYLQPGESTEMVYPGTSDQYRLRTLKSNHIVRFNSRLSSQVSPPSPSPSSLGSSYGNNELFFSETGWSTRQLDEPEAGTVLQIINRGTTEIAIALEKCDWTDEKVTAAKVTTMHEFRGMFSSEVLAPGQQVGVESVTLFFSDLLGSTAYYEDVGDAQAYGKVRRYFDFLLEWIHLNQGTLVKTIGDAVMAIFEKPEHAVQAALDIQRHVDSFNMSFLDKSPIVIKIGLHHGPAIVVTSNERLDYFGRTVNIAARIEGLSRGGDVIISDECRNYEQVRRLLEGNHIKLETFSSSLKGIDEEVPLTRIQIIK
ncbi:adenylate/guanylate cyclase domain-containing protein [Paenibacillus eucommiae]|uniref:Class 3 adenylate cyclase n=1 Tax=Paenibacillus eucommiae TaxID=1355755 RepID=A0ABS4J1W4_9BACL|nr:adenylate/guanylate cyclase domain-containing protein [Paenibacillus eucommiae]MBP1993310.1 class 3 adenylate cyclase [Paenibacillus eucommiae]